MRYSLAFLIILCVSYYHNAIGALDGDQKELEVSIVKADQYYDQIQYDSAEKYYQQALILIDDSKSWKLKCHITNRYSQSRWRQNHFIGTENLIRENYLNCMLYLGIRDTVTADCLLNLGVFHFVSANANAIDYIQKALMIYKDLLGLWHPKTARAYEWLGTVHEAKSDTALAHQYLKQSLMIWERVRGRDHPDLGNIYRYVGLYYKRFGYLDSGLVCFHKAQDLFTQKYGGNNYKSVKCLINAANIYELFDEHDKVKSLYADALFRLDHALYQDNHTRIMLLFNISEYYATYDLHKALHYMQLVYPLYVADFTDSSIYANPEAFKNAEMPLSVPFYKARYFVKLSKQDTSRRIKYLHAAYETYILADQLIEFSLQNLSNPDDWLFIEDLYANLMHEMAWNAFELYSMTDDTTYFTRALNCIEKNKILFSVFVDSDTRFAQNTSPDSLIDKERQLMVHYNNLRDQMAGNSFTYQYDSLRNVLLDTRISLDMLRWEMSKHQIDHLVVNEQTPKIYLGQIQDILHDDKAILMYSEYCHDYINKPRDILVIAISGDQMAYHKLDGFKVYKIIVNYYELVAGNCKTEIIDSVARELYNILLSDLAEILSGREIIIIPSQFISLVPFDGLVFKDLESGEKTYLIEQTLTWKAFSLYSLIKVQNQQYIQNKSDILAIAPSFGKSRKMELAMLTKRDTSMINLIGAKIECEKLGDLYAADLISGPYATESLFKELAPEYNILHISTHGIPDKQNESLVKLAFSNENDLENDGYLSLFEILNLHLNADMVVLSACKTGIGEFNKGEGNMNLAWAFMNAGARSAVISSWDANDYSSSVIMPLFYKHLAEGLSQPAALRQAKLDFLKSSDPMTSSPYYWAGFEFYGNERTLELRASSNTDSAFEIVFAVIAGIMLIFLLIHILNHSITQSPY